MSVIREDIVNQGHGPLSPSYFCVHSTANPGATARNHRDLWARDYIYAVHLVSDWAEAIHTVPYDRLCYQVATGTGTWKAGDLRSHQRAGLPTRHRDSRIGGP